MLADSGEQDQSQHHWQACLTRGLLGVASLGLGDMDCSFQLKACVFLCNPGTLTRVDRFQADGLQLLM